MTFTHWFYSHITKAGLKLLPFEVALEVIRGGLLLASHFQLGEKREALRVGKKKLEKEKERNPEFVG